MKTVETKNKWKVIKESNNYIIKKANSILAKFGQNPHLPKDLIWLYDELDKIGVEIKTTNATRRELKDVDGYKLFPCEVIIDGVVSNHYYATWIVEEHDFGNNYIIYIN